MKKSRFSEEQIAYALRMAGNSKPLLQWLLAETRVGKALQALLSDARQNSVR